MNCFSDYFTLSIIVILRPGLIENYSRLLHLRLAKSLWLLHAHFYIFLQVGLCGWTGGRVDYELILLPNRRRKCRRKDRESWFR
jgi:hypothetical protein